MHRSDPPLAPDNRWQFWIDRGGTFTDVVARAPDGRLITRKLLSEHPERYKDAAVAGIRGVLDLPDGAPITVQRVACVKMGTTVATNALLERKGEPCLLVTTQGYADGLRIAYQNRPQLFAREIVLPELLYSEVVEARERVDAQGAVLEALDLPRLRTALEQAYARGLRSVAIVFLHAYMQPLHERLAAECARALGFTQVSASHEVSPLIKWVSRGDTTVVDAYLSPVLQRYVQQVAREMPGVPLYFMQSSGGLAASLGFRGKDAILSGPAGGIVGMARTAERAGFERVIGFDMGGTSTDVSHYAGAFEREFETQVAGVRVRAPMMSIHTVAAGGGSIVAFDGARLRVGPQSAGADPGPAAYGRGGPLTITDANVLLGRLQPDHFPRVFGPGGDLALQVSVVRDGFEALAQRCGTSTEALAAGALEIAVQQMANAIKKISVSRGYDVTTYVLQCFGGAGGQHACAVADALGMQSVMVHPFAGVLSAYGMGLADQSVVREASVDCPLEQIHAPHFAAAMRSLQDSAAQALRDQQGIEPSAVQLRARLRYAGSDTTLTLPVGEGPLESDWRQRFELAYRQRFGFTLSLRSIVVEALEAEALWLAEAAPLVHGASVSPSTDAAPPVPATARLYANGQWCDAPVLNADSWWAASARPSGPSGPSGPDAPSPAPIAGPALWVDPHSTTVIDPGWQAELRSDGVLVLRRVAQAAKPGPAQPHAQAQPHTTASPVDPIRLEVFNRLFMNIAEQMGLQLQNTAHSVNIKERLDFSCALFDVQGQLIANAPHMPVHLGSMGESIQAVMRRFAGEMRAGDVYVLNDPYHGGTHLPDVTVITPVWVEGSGPPAFYVGSRGHHADIGGISPGSMPPFSRTIEEEGIQLRDLRLVEQGRFCEHELRERLLAGPHPARNPEQNLADLRAQVAANEKGVQELQSLVRRYGLATVQAYMGHVQDNAEEAVRRVLARLRPGRFVQELDSGARIEVAIDVDPVRRTAVIDFTGTSAQLPDNFNAPRAVTTAAVLYVFRTLVDDDIPLNAGCLKPLTLIVPEGTMLNPLPPAAVVAGNVETSSCITNALYGALGVLAGSPGTMNNFTFGNARVQYYETISGGSGAGPRWSQQGQTSGGFPGASVVQVHMTNSRLTDPEVLEARFPVRLLSYTLRRGSGGVGLFPGGDGGVRRIQFLEPMQASILSNARRIAAFGAAGGGDGLPGLNRWVKADGSVETLGALASVTVAAGDVIEIHTPGGGAWGARDDVRGPSGSGG